MKKNLLVALFGAFGVLGNAQTFTNYTSSDGLLADNVNAVDTDANNTIWFGTQNGVSEYDGSTWVDHTNAIDAGLIDDNIQALTVMSNGDIWVGTDFGASVYSGSVNASCTFPSESVFGRGSGFSALLRRTNS